MKKFVYIIAATLVSTSLFAATTAKCFITLTSDQGGTDVLKVLVQDDASNEFVDGSDSRKMINSGNPTNLNIYAVQGTTDCSVVRTNDATDLPIIIETNEIGSAYTLTFSNVTGDMSLYDLVEHTATVIANNATYQFSIATPARQIIADRFVLNHAAPAVYQICYQFGEFKIDNPAAADLAVEIYPMAANGQPDLNAIPVFTGVAAAAATTTLVPAGLAADTQYAIVVEGQEPLIFRVK